MVAGVLKLLWIELARCRTPTVRVDLDHEAMYSSDILSGRSGRNMKDVKLEFSQDEAQCLHLLDYVQFRDMLGCLEKPLEPMIQLQVQRKKLDNSRGLWSCRA